MFIAIRERLERGREEGGFTLIELMVVVLIIAILIAIAIPTFLGARKRAQDKQAQSNVRNALTTEKTYYVDKQAYVTDAAGDLKAIEPNLVYDTTPANAWERKVNETLGAVTDIVVLESLSRSGTLFCLADVASGNTAGTYYAKDTTGAACPTTPTGLSTAGWSTSADAGW